MQAATPRATVTRAFVIGRRRKGRKNGQVIREVERALRKAGWTTDSKLVSKKREIREATAAKVTARYDVVVAVGGDGSVAQAATALARSKVALGIVPTGTGNLLAGNLDLPRDPAEAADVILTGRRRVIDVGRARFGRKKHDFIVACGIGYDAEVMDATDKGQKMKWGKAAYIANAIGQVGEIENVTHEITLDGESRTFEASQVFIANFGRLLPVVTPRQAVRPDDGLLDVIVVSASGFLPGLIAGWEALRQKGTGVSGGGHVFRARASRIRVETKAPRLVEGDGSVIGTTPLSVRVLPGALTVLVPSR